ncbi:MAG: amino acid adenylation domain-containing protein [Bacillota bacterium]|nr:amino acid adenylation domain-containing protein [Bacillota bacterium]
MDKFLLQHLLKDSVQKYPDRIAIIEGERRITYRELDKNSTLLANMLIKMGLLEKEVVAVYINKSIESIVAFLGVLKAGGAYIPIDGNYSPHARIKTILDISETRFVIAKSKDWKGFINTDNDADQFAHLNVILTDTLPISRKSMGNIELIDLGESCVYTDSNLNMENVDRDTASISEDLAYILYTSGSTGAPKGVMLSHLNALTFINWSVSYFNTTCEDIFSSHAPFHFDLSVFDIYAAIASGGCINLIPFQTGQNPRLLFDWIINNKVTYWYSVPSVWISIINYANPDFSRLNELKNILFAGEEFPSMYLKKLMDLYPSANYFNLYGPTETNVCTVYNVKALDVCKNEPIPIGEACANTEIVVINEKNEIARVGEEGELFVRGATVTRGYYKNHEKTQSVFITSPFKHHHGEMLYRTGDLVLKLDEKNYRFIGRIDNMVKISGFRIELQEIVSTILKFELVEEAAVKAIYNEERGSKVLHAFITVKAGQKCSVLKLKEHCSEKLPYYMIPEVFIIIDEMPRNANGKIDSKKLLAYIT